MSSSAKDNKAFELRKKNKAQLFAQLEELKKDLTALRVQKATSGAATKGFQIRDTRKAIARVLTVITQNQRDTLKAFFKGKKYVPLDLRPKKTRAIRRRLTKFEATRMTEKALKKARHFPMRKFAVKA